MTFKLPPNFPSQEAPFARAIVFAVAALIPVWAHTKGKWYEPRMGGWVLLGLAEVALLVGVALLLRAGAGAKKRYDLLTFEVPFGFELLFGGIGAVVLGFTLYATSIIGAGDLSYGPTPKASEITVPSVVAAIFFILVSGGLILIRPVWEPNESGARCTLFGTGLPVIILQYPREKLDAVAIEKPVIDNVRRIVAVVAHIRGKAGPLTFSLPRDAGIPTFLAEKELSQKDVVVAQWRARLSGQR